jgi:hypothetical protein
VDVDRSPALKERFGSRVPVLEINGKVVAEGRMTSAELEQKVGKLLGSG